TLYVGKAAAESAPLQDGGKASLKIGSYTVKIDQKISSNIVLAPAYEPNNPGFETLREGYKFRPTEIIKG
ncbi:MAG TPA: hypothetical protein PKW30_02830, partial [Campylobacterales bacterium]|nr:hypothetical protein [Campylobacterales bacterium]